jgi:hypothetical protein
LAKEAGGLGLCQAAFGVAHPSPIQVFTDANEEDYQKLRAGILVAQAHLNDIKRFDMAGFYPPEGYMREMKRYGILPKYISPSDGVNPYATDRKYWESLWYQPEVGP